MDDGRLENIDRPHSGGGSSDAEMSALFARLLPEEPIPPDLVERTQRIVLSEVRRTIVPARAAQRRQAETRLERLRRWWRNLSPAQSLAMWGAVAAAALLLLIGVTRLAPQTLTAVVSVSDGMVLVLRDQNNSFRTFFDGDILKVDEGDHLITAESSVTLVPFEEQRAMMEPGTHLEIIDLEDDFGNTHVEYMVHRGVLHNVIDETLGESDRYVVNSPLLTVSATGTEFIVQAISGARTRVTVMAGTVTVQMGDKTVSVAAGQVLDATAGAPLQVETSAAAANTNDTLVVSDIDATPIPVYAAPSADSTVIGAIAQNALLRIDDRDNSGGWFLVCCVDDRSGWINVAELGADSPLPRPAATPAAPSSNADATPTASPSSP